MENQPMLMTAEESQLVLVDYQEKLMPFIHEADKALANAVLLGKVACQYTLNEQVFITRDHGVWHERKGVWFMPTFHPSALLRDPAKKRDAWEDFKKIRDKLKELSEA